MQYGCCVGTDISGKMLADLREIGIEYVELPVCRVIELSQTEFPELRQRILHSGLSCISLNLFFPGGLKLLDSTNIAAVREHVKRCGERAAILGGELIVFGSGAARRVPPELDNETGFKRLGEVLSEVSEILEEYCITIAVEPLNQRETNIIHTLSEANSLVDTVCKPNIKIIADYYHMGAEGEAESEINRFASRICHVHFADPETRRYPTEHLERYRVFIDALNGIGYNAPVVFECSTDNIIGDAKKGLEVLRSYE